MFDPFVLASVVQSALLISFESFAVDRPSSVVVSFAALSSRWTICLPHVFPFRVCVCLCVCVCLFACFAFVFVFVLVLVCFFLCVCVCLCLCLVVCLLACLFDCLFDCLFVCHDCHVFVCLFVWFAYD